MAKLRRRLVVPTILAVSVIGGGAAAVVGCEGGSRSDEGDDGPVAIDPPAIDAGATDDAIAAADGGVVDGGAVDATLPDAPPDARPDGPVG